jgi:hypothetical protein
MMAAADHVDPGAAPLMIATSRVDLRVPLPENVQARALGAQYDPERSVWYAPP